MKKTLFFIFTFAAIGFAAGCGGDSTPSTPAQIAQSSPKYIVTITPQPKGIQYSTLVTPTHGTLTATVRESKTGNVVDNPTIVWRFENNKSFGSFAQKTSGISSIVEFTAIQDPTKGAATPPTPPDQYIIDAVYNNEDVGTLTFKGGNITIGTGPDDVPAGELVWEPGVDN